DYGAYALNDADEVVGYYLASGYVHAFRWAGSLQDITINTTTQPSASGYAVAIDAAGQIGGSLTFNCSPSSTSLTAARWSAGGGSVVPLGTYDPCSTSSVLGMNNIGDLVGTGYRIYSGASWNRPTLWHAGAMIDLPTFGAAPGHGKASAINDAGF